MQDFERKKYELDYEADPVEDEGGDLELRLQGRRATHTVAVHLEASQVKQAFHTAFDPELDAIRATTDHVLGLGKDFGTLFLGGTIGQPGLRNILGYSDPCYSDLDIPPQQASSLKFQLVCDPEYDGLTACQPERRRRSRLGRQRKRHVRQVLRPISVCRPEDIMTGRHKTYDLGWAVAGEGLPRGTVRLTIGGKRFARVLAAGASGNTEGQIPALLSCFKVNGAGEKVRNSRDKKWSTSFCTDLGSRYLTVQTLHQVPFWCSHCDEELTGQVRVCKVCEGYSVCYYCYLRHDHPQEHSFSLIDINI
ncbi:hypothetical protein UCDDA912_g10801 [Diaporthe ampelina]|uniref:Uncharacterized protein n=1 Tax=Diaporthe ampelina TaxID=1214573 RepID=A0A0G2E463_9PEZI|nr:hypothetical protein UCDDA912_g10801 [Diaporthe ampelina]